MRKRQPQFLKLETISSRTNKHQLAYWQLFCLIITSELQSRCNKFQIKYLKIEHDEIHFNV